MASDLVLVSYSHQGRVATVTMNRPEVHNALNMQLLNDLATTFAELSQMTQLSAVVLAGAGKSFSAGADLHMMKAAARFTLEQNQEEARQISATFEQLNTFPIPLLARVQGTAAGGGLGLMAVSDIVIASATVRLTFSEVRLGIAPAVISPYVIAKIGTSWARRLFVTGERFTAALARELGLVHTVTAPEQLDAEVENVLQEMLSGGPQALRACKALARDIGSLDLAQARELTSQTIALLRTSTEGQEGLQAFLEKRKPAWTNLTQPIE